MDEKSITKVAKLIFLFDFDERAAFEAETRGCLSHVLVDIEGVRYPVYFYDPIRLQQDLESECENENPFLAETGMIVLPVITLDAMRIAVQRLANRGYFEYLAPITSEKLKNHDAAAWPPRKVKGRE